MSLQLIFALLCVLDASGAHTHASRSRRQQGRRKKAGLLRADLSGAGPDVLVHPSGRVFNRRLHAANVFELDIDRSAIHASAAPRILAELSPGIQRFKAWTSAQRELGRPHAEVGTITHPDLGRLFMMRPAWQSDIVWLSADNAQALGFFRAIFDRLQLGPRLASRIEHHTEVVLLAASIVIRQSCQEANFHADFERSVGTNAFTAMVPLSGAEDRAEDFQLLYHASSAEDEGAGAKANDVRRYVYRPDRAIAFASGFVHSTEPGERSRPQAFLCFNFGSDMPEHWGAIKQTLGSQARFFGRGAADSGGGGSCEGDWCGERGAEVLDWSVPAPPLVPAEPVASGDTATEALMQRLAVAEAETQRANARLAELLANRAAGYHQ